jgi:hypothetical protein
MVATVIEHVGTEGLTDDTVDKLKEFLGRYSEILCEERARKRIERVIGPTEEWVLESLAPIFDSQM